VPEQFAHPPQFLKSLLSVHLVTHGVVCHAHHGLQIAGGDGGGCNGGNGKGGSGGGTEHSAHAPQFLESLLSVHLINHGAVCHAHHGLQTAGGGDG